MQALGAEHSQPFHAYVMGIPGLKICTAASPAAAYGIAKAMVGRLLPIPPPYLLLPLTASSGPQIRDNGPGILFLPVKMMKETKGRVAQGSCMPLNKAALLHSARSDIRCPFVTILDRFCPRRQVGPMRCRRARP